MSHKAKLDDNAATTDTDRKRIKADTDSPVVSMVPVSYDCFLQEEEESKEYNTGEVFSLFEDFEKQLLSSLDSVLKAKTSKDEEAIASIDATNMIMLILEMKKLNRLDKQYAKRNCTRVNESQQKLNVLNLDFQNLQLEKVYLDKEIQKCRDCKLDIADIDLTPIDEFYRNCVQDEMLENDEHELMIRRLRWELKQKQKLLDDLNDAEINREGYKKNIKKLKENLADTKPVLNAIVEATVPMQTKLELPLQMHHSRHKAAKFLPVPMYCLYCQASTYSEVYDKNVKVSIKGSVAKAKSLLAKLDELEESEEELPVKEEEEEKEGEEGVTEKPVRAKRRAAPVKKENEIFEKHPLFIHLTIVDKELQISLEFAYLLNLNLVTVQVKSISANLPPSAAIDKILNIDTIFSCLFPGDNGRKSPNPCVVYRLAESNLENPFIHDKTGLPYAWAQKIGGLHFMSLDKNESNICKRPFETATFMQQTIVAMKSRLRVRVVLNSQIGSIEPGFKLPAELAPFYPHTITSQLKEWAVASSKDLAYLDKEDLLSLNIINEDSMLYKAVISAGSAELTVLVVIPPDYPSKSPLFFLLFLNWETHRINIFDAARRELEKEVNVCCVESIPEQQKNRLLICQLHHLLACFDVFVETAVPKETFEGAEEFVNKMHIGEFGRNPGCNRPYQFLPSRKRKC